MRILTIIFLLSISNWTTAQRLSYEVGIGLGYQPKSKIIREGGADIEILKSRGFIAFQLNNNLMMKINKLHSVGLCLNILSVPEYYYYDLNGTIYSSNFPNRPKRGNLQTENLTLDIGILVRETLYNTKKYKVIADVLPCLKLNTSSSSMQVVGAGGNGADSMTFYHIDYRPVNKLNFSLQFQLGIQKRIRKSYASILFYYYRSFQNVNASYFSMPLTSEFNYGRIEIVNNQIGLKLMYGIGKSTQ